MTAEFDSVPIQTSTSHNGPASVTSRRSQDGSKDSLIRRRVPFLFSVRFGITAWYAGVLILTIAVVGIGFRILLIRAMDQDAEQRLADAASMVEKHMLDTTENLPLTERSITMEIDAIDDFNLQPVLRNGITLVIVDIRTLEPLLAQGMYESLYPSREDLVRLLETRETRYVTKEVEGYSLRSLIYPLESSWMVDPETGEPQIIAMLFATESLATTNQVLAQLNKVLLISGLVGAGIASIGGWMLAGRALAPVTRIKDSAEDIANDRNAASLSRRLEVPRTGDEIAQLAETFNDMLDRIEMAFATQRRFVADASHELRTPITSIRGNIDVLRLQLATGRPLDPQDISEALGDVGRESARMGRLVEDLLSLAQNEGGEGSGHAEKHLTSLDALAAEAIRTAEALVNGQNLTLDAKTPVLVHANGDQLVQVMLILLDNALRHTPAGGSVALRISHGTDPIDKVACARIDVEDTGQGIERDHLPHLFERFYRADRARDRTSGGTGLGLSIALSIVRYHRGWIDVESVPDVGTHFTVWIPLPEDDLSAKSNASTRRTAPKARRWSAA